MQHTHDENLHRILLFDKRTGLRDGESELLPQDLSAAVFEPYENQLAAQMPVASVARKWRMSALAALLVGAVHVGRAHVVLVPVAQASIGGQFRRMSSTELFVLSDVGQCVCCADSNVSNVRHF
jgi:hypothetical protein